MQTRATAGRGLGMTTITVQLSNCKYLGILKISMLVVNTGDCDHLEPYPVYSNIHHNVNLTSWDKPWIPELDWLNSYLNLSTYLQNTLEGLAVGYKITKYAKYFTSTRWGCILMFRWDAELADAYYLEHYSNTNKTMVICTPHIPMETRHFKNSMTFCNYYQLGYLKWLYKQGDLSYILSTSGGVPLLVALVTAGMITIAGMFGEYIPSALP